MKLFGNSLLLIWVIWLLVSGLVAGGIAIRQFQLWRASERGNRFPAFLVFLLMLGWSLNGFIWLIALQSLGDAKLPRKYTLLMLAARTAADIPVWLWLGMLVGAIKESPEHGRIRRWSIVLIRTLGHYSGKGRVHRWLMRWSERLSEPPVLVERSIASGEQPPEFWERKFEEIVERVVQRQLEQRFPSA